ncbi:MAG: hypothetical protein ABIH03_06400 [Pseudomonadota bacterium]
MEREAANDIRPAIAERYRNRDDYVNRIRNAALELMKAGLLLREDAAVTTQAAAANSVFGPSTASPEPRLKEGLVCGRYLPLGGTILQLLEGPLVADSGLLRLVAFCHCSRRQIDHSTLSNQPLRCWVTQIRPVLDRCQQFGSGSYGKTEGFLISEFLH